MNEERLRTGDDGMQCEKWRKRKKHANELTCQANDCGTTQWRKMEEKI